MAITKVSELGDTIPTLIEEAHFIEQFKAVMRGLSWAIPKRNGSTINVPYFSEVTANVLTEGVDMTGSETMEDTNVQVTMNEVGLKIILTDSVIEDDQEDLKRAAGHIMGDAYEKKRDQDLLALMDNGTTSLAGAGTTLTMGHIAASRALLLGNATSAGGPAPMSHVVVIHPFQELDIVDVITPLAPSLVTSGTAQGIQGPTGSLVNEVLTKYSIGRLFGMPIITDGNYTIDGSGDVKAGAFAMGRSGAIIYASAREPDIEPERDASLRGWEMNYVGRYGVGNYLNGWTVELYTDASTPA